MASHIIYLPLPFNFPLSLGILFPASIFNPVSPISVFWMYPIPQTPTDLIVTRVKNVSWWFGLIRWGHFPLPRTIQSVQWLSILVFAEETFGTENSVRRKHSKLLYISNIIKAWNLHSRNSRRASEKPWEVKLEPELLVLAGEPGLETHQPDPVLFTLPIRLLKSDPFFLFALSLWLFLSSQGKHEPGHRQTWFWMVVMLLPTTWSCSSFLDLLILSFPHYMNTTHTYILPWDSIHLK